MTTFKVKICSSDGELFIRQAEGVGPREVREHFSREGYYVFSVNRILHPASFFGFNSRLPIKQFLLFNKEFRGLIRSGLPIVEGFDILLKRMKAGALRTLIEDVRLRLTKGESLSEAFKAHEHQIPRYYPALLLAGEQSGGLAEVLERFIQQEDRIRKSRKRFMHAMTYPAILLVVSFISIYIMLTRALPQFASLYDNSSKSLPELTQFVIGLSEWLLRFYPLLLAGSMLVVTLLFLYGKTEAGIVRLEAVLRVVPLIGPLWVMQNQNVFARTMKLLLSGGIPVPEAVAIVADALPSRAFGLELGRVYQALLRGDSLHEALETHTHMTPLVSEMVRVGEATGTLAEMFEFLAENSEERSEDALEMVSNLVAPIVLLLVGVVIAFLVIAMYLPMFGSYDAMGN